MPDSTSQLEALREVMNQLRSPGGCPWDAEQSHESLLKYLLEESYEFIEAVEENDRAAMREELGDVLLQVFFHARMAEEHPTDPFSVEDVARTVAEKDLVRWAAYRQFPIITELEAWLRIAQSSTFLLYPSSTLGRLLVSYTNLVVVNAIY